ncbi:NAD-dependent epimerase/dehydratase family protein [Massilia sp. W12]|uniref:NAD-dependent epimerase/dehydratase family protein n=1 Tax=Massilia sp. W12 TaxID=3126507 RepID=UPI0030CB8F80
MIIGNGLLAQAFSPRYANDPEVLVFASGVSNSRETDPAAFAREKEMLQHACAEGRELVYFSTCSVHDPELANSPYVQHKKAMEEMVAALPHFAIFRLPQVVGRTPNPHTLTNFLHHQIVSGATFHIWRNARRNLIDVDDVAKIGTWLLDHHEADDIITNIACPFSIAIPDLVAIFEDALGMRAACDVQEAGGKYMIDTRLAFSVAPKAGVEFDDFYVKRLIHKYYAPAKS